MTEQQAIHHAEGLASLNGKPWCVIQVATEGTPAARLGVVGKGYAYHVCKESEVDDYVGDGAKYIRTVFPVV